MLIDFLRVLGRRWYVVVVGLLLTVGLAAGAYVISPPQYTARGLVILLPSQEAVAKGGNPFLALADLDLPARILVSYFQSESAQNAVAAVAPAAKYVVSIEESTRGPVIAIDVKSPTADATLSTLAYIADAIPTNLTRLQTEVSAPPPSFVRSTPLTMDVAARQDISATVRLVVAAAGSGLVVTLIVAFLLDRMLLGAGRRRGIEDDESTPDDNLSRVSAERDEEVPYAEDRSPVRTAQRARR